VGFVSSFRVPRVAALLFCSGMCALVYQVAWFRELRLIFGASTASSAAVLAVFMGGLGLGGARLGKVADRAKNALALYGNLELGVALAAAVTPALVWLATRVYLGAGGSTTLGLTGATALRLVLSVVVLGPATFLMGGTLPAAARAVERDGDPERRRVATLYGVNTMGAVLGAVLANFVLLEVLGTRATLWAAALVNALVAMLARSFARARDSLEPEPASRSAALLEMETPTTPLPLAAPAAAPMEPAEPAVAERAPWFPPAASALAGVTFMLMELTWYRMLAPILGGSSYTFGLILAVALVGIGIGGGVYARSKVRATFRAFALTCGLEAVFVAIPFAIGDRLAIVTALLRPFCRVSFGASVVVWTAIAAFVVLPAAIVSGAQFPLVIGLYGRGGTKVGRDVGAAYLANTLGAIFGSLAGGFGLLPLLGAVGCWRLAVGALVLGATVALALDARHGGKRDAGYLRGMAIAVLGLLLVGARGPTGVWRHSGIGAGRADLQLEPVDGLSVQTFENYFSRDQKWEEDGIESSVALGQSSGYAFIVNGKSDGHAIIDAPTQVMSGLVPALLHPAPKSTLVVGLGTGSTAGWLGAIPTMERVDVVELEPAILRVAKDCAPVNRSVLDNPKVHIQLADAREVLRATPSRYDIVFSEPSNPYRAGISSMYTVEYYRAVADRLNPGGLFVQWMQAYEVDGWAVATAIVTIRQVFAELDVWETESGDLLLIGSVDKRPPLDVARMRARLTEEPFATAARSVWHTDSVEGVFAHFVANTALSDVLVRNGMGAVNTDDQNLLEFAFARSVGRRRRVDRDLRVLAARLGIERPLVAGAVAFDDVLEERWLFQTGERTELTPAVETRPDLALGHVIALYSKGRHAAALIAWKKLGRPPRHHSEATLVAELAARVGGLAELPLIELAPPGERDFLRAFAHWRGGDGVGAAEGVRAGFMWAQRDPWVRGPILELGVDLATQVGATNRGWARTLHDVLRVPFAVDAVREPRLLGVARLARLAGDAGLCVTALEPLEPPVLEQWFLETRAACYRAAGHELADRAERELAAFSEKSRAFGETIPGPKVPPAGKRPTPPQTAPGDAGIGADAGPDAAGDAAGDAGAARGDASGDGGPAANGPGPDDDDIPDGSRP